MALNFPNLTALPPELLAATQQFQPQMYPAPGQAVSPMAPAAPAPAPAPAPNPNPLDQASQGIIANLANDPAAAMALLRFAGGAIQPVRPGQSEAGILGEALAGGAETFMRSRKSEQDTATKREGLAEQKRQDEEVNPLEQSLIDYRDAMGASAMATAQKKGMTESQYKQQVRSETLGAIMKGYKMTYPQAVTALAMGEKVDFINFDDIAERVLAAKAAEAGAFDIEDIGPAAESFQSRGVVGTGISTPNRRAIAEVKSWNADQFSQIEANPAARQKVIDAIGELEYLRAKDRAR